MTEKENLTYMILEELKGLSPENREKLRAQVSEQVPEAVGFIDAALSIVEESEAK